MSETLHHSSADAESTPIYDEIMNANRTTEVNSESLSPAADRVRTAAERIATFLERRTISQAHSAALKEYRDRDPSGYVDHVSSLASATDEDGEALESQRFNQKLLTSEERRADREELVDAGKEHLRAMGSIGLENAKRAGLIALGVGLLGYAAAEKQARVVKFKTGTKIQNHRFKKNYEKEMARFDKKASKDSLKLEKQTAKDLKGAAKEDRRFERSMKRKVTAERWQGRKEKVVTSYESKKQSVRNKKAKLGQFALKAHETGRIVIGGREN